MKALTLCAAVLGLAAVPGFAGTVPVLGSAVDFAVLGGSTVTNTGPTTLTGSASVTANLGVSPGTAITGVDLITFTNGNGAVPQTDAVRAQTALTKAYNALSAAALPLPYTADLSGQNLGDYHTGVGGVGALGPGVYKFNAAAEITTTGTRTLELDAQNTDGACWVFQIRTTLTTATDSFVTLINPNAAGNNGADIGVFWLVGSSATLGSDTKFEGNILAMESITMGTGADILNGRALALTGAVTLNNNSITDYNNGPGFSGGLVFDSGTNELVPITIPEPSMFGVLALSLATLWGYGRRRTFAAGSF